MQTYFPGTRVVVFDSRLYKDDRETPISETLCMATVCCWYGKEGLFGQCKSLVDVEFDHNPGHVSKGHFTFGLKKVETEEQAEAVVKEVTKNASLSPVQEFYFRKKIFAGLNHHHV